MSEIMDDYDAGFQAGQHDLNRIVALREDLAYEKGFEKGLLDGYTKSIVLLRSLQRSIVPEKNVDISDCIIDRRLQWKILEQAMELISEKILTNTEK